MLIDKGLQQQGCHVSLCMLIVVIQNKLHKGLSIALLTSEASLTLLCRYSYTTVRTLQAMYKSFQLLIIVDIILICIL